MTTIENIGAASKASGVSAKMIRHYEDIGLLPKVARSFGNYRVYSANDIHVLRFIRRARDLGFSIEEIQQLLGLWQNRRRASAEVRRLAQRHIADLEAKIRKLQEMRATLEGLVQHCHGDSRPECPILDDLAASRTLGRGRGSRGAPAGGRPRPRAA